MAYNQRNAASVPQNSNYDALPKINDKRYSNVIDYNQQRPQSGYGQQQYDNGQGYGQDQRDSNVSSRMTNGSQAQYGASSSGPGKQSIGASGPVDFDASEGMAVQLIQADPRTGKFQLNEEFAAELMNFEGNISFVTVAGKYRTGKSFLLNKLLNLQGHGFVVDPATDACTQGIWVWSKPVYNERDNLHIFFLDTEGSNSVEKSATHDAKIFALSLLMSSYFIYNSVGSIDENSINDLSLTTQLSRNIAISTDENSEHALSYYTPKFLWALRDFTLELQDAQGKAISANQYLENALTDQSTHSKTSETNKKIRQALLQYFKDREAMTFVRPANDERDLRKLNSVPNTQIRPEFNKQVNVLRDRILSKATAKQLKGVNLNMRMYIAMLRKYVDAINQGSVPNIATAWDHLVENECREAYEQSVELYEIALKQFFFNEDRAKSIEDLYNILKNIRDSTLEKYNKITAAIERNDVAQDYKNELKDYIDKKEQAAVSINEEINQVNNEELLKNLSQIIKDNITSGVYGPSNLADFYEDYGQFLATFDAEGQGFTKTTSLVRFLSAFQPEILTALIQSANKNHQTSQKTLEQDKARIAENEKNLKQNLEILKEKEKNTTDELQRLKNEKAELSHKTTKLSEQMQKLKIEDEAKIEEEKAKAQKQQKALQEKEREAQTLSAENKRLLEEIAKRKKNGCCNIF